MSSKLKKKYIYFANINTIFSLITIWFWTFWGINLSSTLFKQFKQKPS